MDEQNNNPALLEFGPNEDIIFTENVTDEMSSSSSLSGSGSPIHQPAQAHNKLHATLVIKNTSDTTAVLFRIQTTSPMSFKVKPSHGRIESGQTQVVEIGLLSEPKKNDKFLINSVPTSEPADSSIDFMTQYNSVPESLIRKHRMKCSFPHSFGGLLSVGSGGAINAGGATGAAPMSPVVPVIRNDNMGSPSALTTGGGSINAGASDSNLSLSALQMELREAQSTISTLLSQIAELKKSSSKSSSIPNEWKEVLSGQYGAPPVLVLLVAVFAFMLGLLF